ncbi:MAG TPA: hypothetical protein VFN92_10695 [Solirubrobacterales bacterium]|nr:hypothetical protein [Solirubrobacterales bacterium]
MTEAQSGASRGSTGATGPCVAIASYVKRPTLRTDDRLLTAALEAEGIRSQAVVWDDESVDWEGFDGCILRSVSDYHRKFDLFLDWLAKTGDVLPIWNPIDLVAWNADKSHLRELVAAGVPIVPTHWLPRGAEVRLDEVLGARGWEEAVLKPTVGLGAQGLNRVRRAEPGSQEIAERMLDLGGVMVQPFLPTIESHGETSLVFIDGELSHAVRKRPAPGDFRVQPHWGGSVAPVEPAADELEVAAMVLARLAAPALFARVDLVRSAAGEPLLIELELVEPILFLEADPAAAPTLAEALGRRLSDGRPPAIPR